MSLRDNIVAYYKFDSDNSNDSVGSNNGTDTNMTYGSSYGKLNDGARFTSNTDYIHLTSGVWSLFSGTNAWSISVWASFPGLASNAHIFGANVSDGSSFQNYGLNFTANSDGSVSAYHGNGTNTETVINSSTGLVTSSGWYHIVATFDGSTTYALYVNNASSNTASGRSYTSGTMGSAYLGVARYSGGIEGGGNRYFDEFAFWSRALSSGEVSQLYNSGAGFQYPFPIAYTLSLAYGAYAFSYNAITLTRKHILVAAYSALSVAAQTATFSFFRLWNRLTKNTTSLSNQSKNSSSWSNQSQNSSSFSNQAKS